MKDPMHTEDELTAFTPEDDEELKPVLGERVGETYTNEDGTTRHVQAADRPVSGLRDLVKKEEGHDERSVPSS